MREEHPWPNLIWNNAKKMDLYITKRSFLDELFYYYRKAVKTFENFRRKCAGLLSTKIKVKECEEA